MELWPWGQHRDRGAEQSGRFFLTGSFVLALPSDFERAGTASNLPSQSNATPWSSCLKRFSTSSCFHKLPPRKTRNGGSYLGNCSEIPSRHLVHSSSGMFAIQCIHLDSFYLNASPVLFCASTPRLPAERLRCACDRFQR